MLRFNLRKEPSFKCLILRLLIPFCELFDALVSLFSFTVLESNFGFSVTVKYAVAYQKAMKH